MEVGGKWREREEKGNRREAVRGRGDKVERKTDTEGRGRKWGKGTQRVE